MKPFVLRPESISLSLKSELKIFLFMQTYEKAESALKGSLLEPPTVEGSKTVRVLRTAPITF